MNINIDQKFSIGHGAKEGLAVLAAKKDRSTPLLNKQAAKDRWLIASCVSVPNPN